MRSGDEMAGDVSSGGGGGGGVKVGKRVLRGALTVSKSVRRRVSCQGSMLTSTPTGASHESAIRRDGMRDGVPHAPVQNVSLFFFILLHVVLSEDCPPPPCVHPSPHSAHVLSAFPCHRTPPPNHVCPPPGLQILCFRCSRIAALRSSVAVQSHMLHSRQKYKKRLSHHVFLRILAVPFGESITKKLQQHVNNTWYCTDI